MGRDIRSKNRGQTPIFRIAENRGLSPYYELYAGPPDE
jgi:hypothetical protein